MVKFNRAQLTAVAQRFKLKFVILHGSQATGRSHKGSDVDIAVLGKKPLSFRNVLKLHSALADIFGDNAGGELDLKTLHLVDPLFRYEVVRDGALLYGDPTEYEEFKAMTLRAYEDAKPLRELEQILSRRYQKHLNKLTPQYA